MTLGSASRFALVIGLVAASAAQAEVGPHIAGTTPDRRPEGAPTITTFAKDADWWVRAERGITPPVPASVRQALEAQGAWYTPLTRPGIPGRYDLRGLHRP